MDVHAITENGLTRNVPISGIVNTLFDEQISCRKEVVVPNDFGFLVASTSQAMFAQFPWVCE